MSDLDDKIRYYWKQGYIDPRIGEKLNYHRSTIGKRRRNKLDLPVVREHSNDGQFKQGEMERSMVTVLYILRDKQPHEKQEVEEELIYLPEMFEKILKLLKHNSFVSEVDNMLTITTRGFDFYTKNQDWLYWKQQEVVSS
jgi:hypothetical protein